MTTAAENQTPNLTEVLGDEATCTAKLRQLFRNADMHPMFPMTSAEVSELLRENGYAASVEVLEDFCRRGLVPDCRIRQGQFAWSAQNALTAAIHCDTWRMFIPLHPRCLHRLTALELAEMQAALEGGSVFTDADTFTVRAMVQMLDSNANEELRHVIAVALKSRLDKLGVLDK